MCVCAGCVCIWFRNCVVYLQPPGDVVFRLFTILVFQMQIFDYLIRASNAASLFQSEKGDLHDIVSNSYCKEQKFHFNLSYFGHVPSHGYHSQTRVSRAYHVILMTDRIPKIGFSGTTRNQPKNGFKQVMLNKAFLHFLPNFWHNS